MREGCICIPLFFYLCDIMAKRKTSTTAKAVTKKPENKAQKIETTTKEAKYSGYVVMGGARLRMSEAKARLLVKEGKAKFD